MSCLGCGDNDTYLCVSCLASIQPLLEQSCPLCRRHITPHGETCFTCLPRTALDGVLVGYSYDQTVLDAALHAFKYHSLETLSEPLGELLVRALKRSDLPLPDLLLPVPLHPWRLRYRGFNQSELLGKYLAKHLLPGAELPLQTTGLIRHRFTLPQQKMPSAQARKENIHNAFLVPKTHRSSLKNKSVWLIDDVTTTASTLNACARVLKQAGVKKVFGVVLARGT